MSSGRTLGRGRVLGSAQSLPPPPTAPTARPQHKRNTSLLSPSESSVSLNSQLSNSPASTVEAHDLLANVSLGTGDNAAAAAASSRLVCPICNEEMVTLLQLNRHIDDLHANLEAVQQDEVKTWFEAQMTKAKKFQPLAVLNQKFKGLDVFESNDPPAPVAPIPKASSGHSTPEPSRVIDPDEVVSRTHWQRSTYNDSCADPMCGKRLGGANGSVNCRHCGKLFCEEHTMYQMKLSRAAKHDPVRGIWCRVCETCYKSRDGYIDHKGFERNHTDHFTAIRRKTVDKQYLEVSRLEKRLTKLTQLLANPPPDDPGGGGGGILWPLNGAKAQQRALEQSVIAWEDDASVPKCPFCQQSFTSYTFRRHHCRVCGRVVCNDPQTDCSANVPLNVASPADPPTEKTPTQTVALDIRLCKDCRHTLFSKTDFQSAIQHKPADARSYENLVQFERGIRLLLPKFQKLLQALQDPEKPPTHDQVMQAQKTRKRLTDSFIQYETAARRIRDLKTESATQARLQKAVHAQATSFLHLHMLPLKSLPKILKHASPHGNTSGTSSPRPNTNGIGSKLKPNGGGALASIHFATLNNDSSSQISSRSSAIESLEAEEKELRERLIVLEEQKFIVNEMLNDARKRRKFDEVASLSTNVDDLTREIDEVGGQLAQLDFAGAYGGGGTGLPGTPPVVVKGGAS